ncbi:hypothetical protein OYC64_000455 [Pagothenia borchgrevinki]|uniref:Uncharacterized protein n=1 Tax=Pagothenia borchgrevinki TaxID=8213 RepID=A0ABD2HDY6_PAGBO
MSGRNPFPPTHGFTTSGSSSHQRKAYDRPTHIAQTEEPWSRLYDSDTCASYRQSVMHYEPKTPKDSLDFHLRSVYDHHKDFFWGKNRMLYQKETVSEDQRKQGNSKKDMLEKEQGDEIRVWVDPQRRSIYSIK